LQLKEETGVNMKEETTYKIYKEQNKLIRFIKKFSTENKYWIFFFLGFIEWLVYVALLFCIRRLTW
jgi:hypothetical protein